MAGVVFIFVREDASEAETLAEAFDAAGYSITGNEHNDDALAIVIWSRAALYSHAFKHAAERALLSGRALVASLIAPPPRENVFGAPVIDLSAWDGEDGPALDALFEAASAIAQPPRANVITLPFRPAYEDAEFLELSPDSAQDERVERARRAWEAPIPTDMLRPARAEPVPQKTGAATPRRDFTRLGARKTHARAHAALAFALVALVGGGVIAMNRAPAPAPHARVVQIPAEPVTVTPVSLASASADATGLPDVTPVEPAPLFEPAPQGGHAGVEPPSARAARQRRAARGDYAAYQPPMLIPDAIVADIERSQTASTSEPRG